LLLLLLLLQHIDSSAHLSPASAIHDHSLHNNAPCLPHNLVYFVGQAVVVLKQSLAAFATEQAQTAASVTHVSICTCRCVAHLLVFMLPSTDRAGCRGQLRGHCENTGQYRLTRSHQLRTVCYVHSQRSRSQKAHVDFNTGFFGSEAANDEGCGSGQGLSDATASDKHLARKVNELGVYWVTARILS
jgi:hypothetical protein